MPALNQKNSFPALSRLGAFLTLLALAACAGGHNPAVDLSGTQSRSEQCAPYARSLTGLALSGAAYEWWNQADGRYARSSVPRVGAVLVFRRSSRLPYGHVSVVAKILSPREIMVNQANWVHNRISHDDIVRDVSSANDWTLVRVWWRPSASLGITPYPTYGFVGPVGAALADLFPVANPRLQEASAGAICAPSIINMAAPKAG